MCDTPKTSKQNDVRPMALWVPLVPAILFTVEQKIAHSVYSQALCFYLDSMLRTSPPPCGRNRTDTFNIKTLATPPTTDCLSSLKTLLVLSGTSTWNTRSSNEVLACANTRKGYGRTK